MRTRHHSYQVLMFLTCLLAASWAQAATYNLVFFDVSKKIVGNGQFTADPNKIYTYSTASDPKYMADCQAGGKSPQECTIETDYDNQLTGFSATIKGVGADSSVQDTVWGLEGINAWWKGAGHSPGTNLMSKNLSQLVNNGWIFGDILFGVKSQLSMGFDTATDSSASGKWDFFTSSNVQGNGTWTATLVTAPIPAAIWLFASGLGLLGVVKRKRR